MDRSLDHRAPRVLYCTDTYPPQVNGVSIVTALSVSGLRARGWECGVIAPRYPEQMSQPSAPPPGRANRHTSIASVAFPPYPDIRLAAPDYRAVAHAVRDFRPDIIHCETEFIIGRMGQIAAQRAGIPCVSSYHTDFGRYTAAYGFPWLRAPVSRYIARFHSRSLRVYTPSLPAKEDLARHDVRDVEVWGRGVDTTAFHPNQRSESFRSAREIDSKIVFLHVGRLAAEKGTDRILRAFTRARDMLPAGAIHLVIAGTGPEEAQLRRIAPPDVTFLGVLDRAQLLPRVYASADAFLFSSLTETLGLVVLEAMASGLPVVATPAGGVADHLRDGVNGIAFPADDVDALTRAIVALAVDPALRVRLGLGARRTAETLAVDIELDRLDTSYREVLARA